MNNIGENFKHDSNNLPSKNAKLVNSECIPIKSCNACYISKPVDMQVYKIEKASLNHSQRYLKLTCNTRQNRVHFCVSLSYTMSLYESKIFKAKRQLYVVINAFANHLRVTQNALDWRHLIKLENLMCFHKRMIR